MASSIVLVQGSLTATGGGAIATSGTPAAGTRRWRATVTQDSTVGGDTDLTVSLTDFNKKIGPNAGILGQIASAWIVPRNAACYTASVRIDPSLLNQGQLHLICTAASGSPVYDLIVEYEHSLVQ